MLSKLYNKHSEKLPDDLDFCRGCYKILELTSLKNHSKHCSALLNAPAVAPVAKVPKHVMPDTQHESMALDNHDEGAIYIYELYYKIVIFIQML